jgi:hypothetical protein
MEKRERLAENLAWQIGSDKPPTVCLCCGSRFDAFQHLIKGPYLSGPYIWVCQWCWEKPYLFFPDKENDFPIQIFDDIKKDKVGASQVPGQKFPLKLGMGRELECEVGTVSLSAIHLDPKNVRLKHFQTKLSEKEIEGEIWKNPSARALFRSIEAAEGLSTPPIVDSKFIVREGNRRIVCLRKLYEKIVNGQSNIPLWKIDSVLCYVLPTEANESDIAIYLALEHVTGKKEWMAINQAAHVHELSTIHNLSFEEIEKSIGLNRSLLSSAAFAYQKTFEYHNEYPNDKDWLNKYSYFYELVKKPNLKEWSVSPKFNRVTKWINSGQIQRGEEIRHIPEINSDERMRKKISSGGTFKDAISLGTKLKIQQSSKVNENHNDTLSIILNTGRILHKIRISVPTSDKKEKERQIEAAKRLNSELSLFLKSAKVTKSRRNSKSNAKRKADPEKKQF